ncbi:MAG TPA: maleylpyruvate isomerase N-terminal domain-containing protein [Chloroflexia bacterium]|nr:maleylpyruvate isomerase N-terminal domain-containing protein [Chloroflexia bacterium]
MSLDPSFTESNRASTARMQALVARLSDAEMQTPVGEHWTVAIVLAHLAFWDRRVRYVLDMTERDGEVFVPQIDIFVNDLSLPLWAAIPPREAARIALETAADLDARLAAYAPDLLDALYAYNPRWVVRALHRNEHLDEAEAALRGDV